MRWRAFSDMNLLAHCLTRQPGTRGSPAPGLPMCLVAAGRADVSIDCKRMEVDCKIEQQVKGDLQEKD